MAVPTSRPKLRSAFKNARQISPIYTSGPVAVTRDGQKVVSCVGDEILLTDVNSGTEICRFLGDTQTVSSLCLTPSSSHLLVFTSSLSLRIFELPKSSTSSSHTVSPLRVIARAHDAPIHVCESDPTSTYLASGSADGVVKVWDIMRGFATHVFKGHGGVVSALKFNYPQDSSSLGRQESMQLITASVDTRIRIFELNQGKSSAVAVLEAHASVPRGLDVSSDGRWLLSGGRDSVVLVWDLQPLRSGTSVAASNKKGKDKMAAPKLIKTIPILERVEALAILYSDEGSTSSSASLNSLQFFTGGESGLIKIWQVKESNVVFTLGNKRLGISDESEEQRQIIHGIYLPEISTIISVHADQNILFHSISSRQLSRQLIGFNDEIVDITFLSPAPSHPQRVHDTHIALATNSSLIRVYSSKTLDARLLEGHTDVVLALDRGADGRVLASGSKDRSARIWAPNDQSGDDFDWGFHCAAVCEGHSESVGAVAMSRQSSNDDTAYPCPAFMFTGSQDRTIKMWDLSQVEFDSGKGSDPTRCKSLTTVKAHDKDINSLDVAPNDRLLVSGSQDRTAKIFAISFNSSKKSISGSLALLGVCKGHKRGVWTVRFGKEERVLATGSGDKTIKLWNIDDFSCIKTFEGHTNSVLRVDFINAGMQMVSSASDGLVKLWNVREEECMNTMDNHEDKVWALAISSDEKTIVSGGADSVVTFWEDCTEEEQQEQETRREEMVLKEQDYHNYLSLNDYRRAIQLALAMQQPGRLLSLFREVGSRDSFSGSFSGDSAVDQVLRTLSGSDLTHLLRYARDWNANAKTSEIAQRVLFTILKLRTAEDVMKTFADEAVEMALANGSLPDLTVNRKGGTALKELIDSFIPYTERHLSRIDKLLQESYTVDYILGEMDDGMFDENGDLDMNQ